MNDLLEAIELEVRIAAAKSVREHIQQTASGERGAEPPHDARALDALTDALITLRTQQIDKMWPETPDRRR